MSETSTGTPAPDTNSAPSVPEGQTLVSKAEYEALQAQINGFKEAGFESAEQVKPWASVLTTASKANIQPDQVAKLLAPPEVPDQPGSDKPLTAKELQAMLDARDSKMHFSLAEQEHQRSVYSQASDLQKQASEMIGDSLPANMRSVFIEGLLSKYDAMRLRASYPVGHPLHGQFNPPLGQDKIKELVGDVKKYKEELQAHRLGQIANAGNAARNTGQPYTPQASGQQQVDMSKLSPAERVKAQITDLQARGVRG